jgi:diguanylate cyclase (GGDEF)-like protein/PAS domain S-box-containing protein
MNLDIPTLLLLSSVIFGTETVAGILLYSVAKTYRGLGWWLAGTVLQSLGFLCMYTWILPSDGILPLIADPLVILGMVVLNKAILDFTGKKDSVWILAIVYSALIAVYCYFALSGAHAARSILVSATAAVIMTKTGTDLLRGKTRKFSGTAIFTAGVYLAYGLFQMAMTVLNHVLPSGGLVIHESVIRTIAHVAPIVVSMLWTFGFIIMISQRLNAENADEREKLLKVFNTSPDAQMITHMDDGLIDDVNEGFLSMTGFSREEVLGKSTRDIRFWSNHDDRKKYRTLLENSDAAATAEFIFRRKDGTSFVGSITGRVIGVFDRPHIISVIQDLTEKKQSESRIQDLIRQLEMEKAVAEINAITDGLTGLANRRYFDESLRTEFFRLKRSGAPLSFIMLDIDHFKTFNDTYGHLAGDNCLKEIGGALKGNVRRVHDIVARYGGEEFAVIMPETESRGAAALAEQIRKSIEELGIPHSASDAASVVTVSLGVITAYPAVLTKPEEIIAMADEALYAAKGKGRNRVEISTRQDM